MKNKKTLLIIGAFVLLAAILLTVFLLTRPRGNEEEKTFTVAVTHADGSEERFTVTSSREFVSQALLDEGILTPDGTDDGYYEIVDGEKAVWDADQAYWSYLINGEYASIGMDTTPIEDGAVYALVYTGGEYGA